MIDKINTLINEYENKIEANKLKINALREDVKEIYCEKYSIKYTAFHMTTDKLINIVNEEERKELLRDIKVAVRALEENKALKKTISSLKSVIEIEE